MGSWYRKLFGFVFLLFAVGSAVLAPLGNLFGGS